MRTRFGPFTLDGECRQLTRDGLELHLTPKAFDLLTTLVEQRPAVVSKAALQEHLWPETFVVEANLSNLVAEVRDALGDSARTPVFIRTVHGFGYAFCGDACPLPSGRDAEVTSPAGWLEWGPRRFPLAIGEHVIGRDPDVEIRLDATTVSRRHARLVVSAEGTTIEDFVSKNGTYRGNERVASPVALADGDAIRIGSLLLIFHATPRSGTTDTLVQPGAPLG